MAQMVVDKCSFCEDTKEDDGVDLYICTICKNGTIFCASCGKLKHKKKEHKFKDHRKCIDECKHTTQEIAMAKMVGDDVIKAATDYLVSEREREENIDFTNVVATIISAVKMGDCAPGICNAMADNIVDLATNSYKEMQEVATRIAMNTDIINTNLDIVEASAKTAAGVVWLAETAFDSYQLYQGMINWKEFGRRSVRSIVRGTGSACGNMLGFEFGANFGFAVGGPPGAFICGFLGSIIGAIAGGAAVNAIFDKIWPEFENKEQKQMEEMLNSALQMFAFDKEQMNDPTKFNYEKVKIKYNQLVKIYHPDRGGCASSFIALKTNYGILLALTDPNKDKNQKEQIKGAVKKILEIELEFM